MLNPRILIFTVFSFSNISHSIWAQQGELKIDPKFSPAVGSIAALCDIDEDGISRPTWGAKSLEDFVGFFNAIVAKDRDNEKILDYKRDEKIRLFRNPVDIKIIDINKVKVRIDGKPDLVFFAEVKIVTGTLRGETLFVLENRIHKLIKTPKDLERDQQRRLRDLGVHVTEDDIVRSANPGMFICGNSQEDFISYAESHSLAKRDRTAIDHLIRANKIFKTSTKHAFIIVSLEIVEVSSKIQVDEKPFVFALAKIKFLEGPRKGNTAFTMVENQWIKVR